MREFSRPPQSTIPDRSLASLQATYTRTWRAIESGDVPSPTTFARVQSEAMLSKLALEQICGTPSDIPEGRLKQLISRDFGGTAQLFTAIHALAARPDCEWTILGLSFADFRFHVFPVKRDLSDLPFCISPVGVFWFAPDEINATNFEGRAANVRKILTELDWAVVAGRVTCLEEPLELLGEFRDCAICDSARMPSDEAVI